MAKSFLLKANSVTCKGIIMLERDRADIEDFVILKIKVLYKNYYHRYGTNDKWDEETQSMYSEAIAPFNQILKAVRTAGLE